METNLIEKFKKGDIIKLVDKNGAVGKTVFVFEGYCRLNKGYELSYFNDISRCKYVKKGTLATDDFIF